jgi:hypothetical protein
VPATNNDIDSKYSLGSGRILNFSHISLQETSLLAVLNMKCLFSVKYAFSVCLISSENYSV